MTRIRIDADRLIPGRGDPVARASVIIRGTRIEYAGPAAELDRDAPPVADLRVPTLMPGMWDCHCHFHGIRQFSLEHMLVTPVPTAAARAAKEAEAAISAGFTSVREAGGLGVWLVPAIDEGTVNGPSVYAAGSLLSPSGGHADVHTMPYEWVAGSAEDGRFLHLCDGVPQCLQGVRLQLRKGARVIKVCASGGITSTRDDPIHQQFTDDELGVIVAEAARADRVVMAHCHGKPGIMAALRAGVHSIEHGSYLDEEAAKLMVDQDAVLVPTRSIIDRMLRSEASIPPHAYRKVLDVAERHRDAIGIAHQLGVTIACGTDVGTTGPDSFLPWGSNGTELQLLNDAGLEPLEAIETATANGPITLGPQAPLSGQLKAGYDADVIAVSGDPLQDLSMLANPQRISHVWRLGALVKAPAETARS